MLSDWTQAVERSWAQAVAIAGTDRGLVERVFGEKKDSKGEKELKQKGKGGKKSRKRKELKEKEEEKKERVKEEEKVEGEKS